MRNPYGLLLAILIALPVKADDFESWLPSDFVAPPSAGSLLRQDEVQALCSSPSPVPAQDKTRLEAKEAKAIQYPKGGQFLGDMRRGEVLAYGTGDHQGNCVGCHQLQKSDVAYGTLGPSLVGYGRARSSQDYPAVWAQLFNAKAKNLCSVMPRFGQRHILDELMLKDVMSFLLDPSSPVNRDHE